MREIGAGAIIHFSPGGAASYNKSRPFKSRRIAHLPFSHFLFFDVLLGKKDEFRRLYAQLELLKDKNVRLGNRRLVAKIAAMQEAANSAETQVATIHAISATLRSCETSEVMSSTQGEESLNDSESEEVAKKGTQGKRRSKCFVCIESSSSSTSKSSSAKKKGGNKGAAAKRASRSTSVNYPSESAAVEEQQPPPPPPATNVKPPPPAAALTVKGISDVKTEQQQSKAEEQPEKQVSNEYNIVLFVFCLFFII